MQGENVMAKKKFNLGFSEQQKDYLKIINSNVTDGDAGFVYVTLLDALRSHEKVFINALAVAIASELENRFNFMSVMKGGLLKNEN